MHNVDLVEHDDMAMLSFRCLGIRLVGEVVELIGKNSRYTLCKSGTIQ